MSRTYHYTLSIGYAKARHEDERMSNTTNAAAILGRTFTDEELADKTEEEIERYVEEDYQNWCSNFMDGGFERLS